MGLKRIGKHFINTDKIINIVLEPFLDEKDNELGPPHILIWMADGRFFYIRSDERGYPDAREWLDDLAG